MCNLPNGFGKRCITHTYSDCNTFKQKLIETLFIQSRKHSGKIKVAHCLFRLS